MHNLINSVQTNLSGILKAESYSLPMNLHNHQLYS